MQSWRAHGRKDAPCNLSTWMVAIIRLSALDSRIRAVGTSLCHSNRKSTGRDRRMFLRQWNSPFGDFQSFRDFQSLP